MKISQVDWEAKGRELFGDDKGNWKFICPKCGDEISLHDVRKKYPDVNEWCPGQECIGRYINGVGCDWDAYGLFRGPVIVIATDNREEIPCFDFAGKPFTSKK